MITLTWCDRHLQDKDEEVPAEQFHWGNQHVDLCEECAGPVLEAAELFTKYGSDGKRTPPPQIRTVKKAQAAQKDERATCPECGREYLNRGSLGSHARQIHGKSLGALTGSELTHKCRWCDAGYTTGQGQSLHERARHPVEYQQAQQDAKQTAAAT